MWDVAIVGAGPSGSIAAYLLAKRGYKTLILDKNSFPRHKPCGGGITLKAGKLLNEIGLPIEPVDAFHKEVLVKGFGLEIEVRTGSGEYAIAVVRRNLFDKRLLDEAVSEGAVFKKAKVLGVKREGDAIRLVGINETSSVVVGADGANSVVAVTSGLRSRWSREDIIFAIEGVSQPHEKLTFMVDAAPYGYGWIFPRGKDSNAGVGGMLEKSKEIKRSFDRLAARYKVVKAHSWIIPVGGHDKSIVDRSIFLVGDAAGLADPLTGEGLYYAIRSSLEVSESLDHEEPELEYRKRMEPVISELKEKRRAAKIIMPRIKFFFKLFVAYPEIAERYMLTSIGRVEFRDFWRWSISKLPRALIKEKLGI